jgi:hypothetical protein
MNRSTTDLHTGKPFHWNMTVLVRHDGKLVRVPAYGWQHGMDHLAPSRVPADLLAELNSEEPAR